MCTAETELWDFHRAPSRSAGIRHTPAEDHGAAMKEVRRVLLLHSIAPSSLAIFLVERQIRALLEETPYQIRFHTDYMDTNRFPDEAARQEVRDSYIHSMGFCCATKEAGDPKLDARFAGR